MKILTASHSHKPSLTEDQIRKGFVLLDITIKSGCEKGWVLAPTWEMVNGIKSGNISEKDFTMLYNELLEKRWARLSDYKHDEFKAMKAILVCYCPQGVFCHRYLAAKFLVDKYGATYFGEYR